MNLLEKIKKLKKQKNIAVVAHNYQIPEIQDIADFVGDSLELAKIIRNFKNKVVIFCGVRFMAETAKILAPEKKILIPSLDAGCPLADSISVAQLTHFKKNNPKAQVVCYVNTNADIKAESNICCTSANAIEVVKRLKIRRIIFLPDRNLAYFVAKNTDKDIIPWNGYCPVHEKIKKKDIIELKRRYPDAEVIAHPECLPPVQKLATKILSTGGMVEYVKNSESKIFIIATEEGIIHRLKKENPTKKFIPARNDLICEDMKKITLENLYKSLKEEKYEIKLPLNILKKALNAIERMVENKT